MNIKNEVFNKVNACQYSQSLKEQFASDKQLWLNAITPESKAKELIAATGNDYSLIWDEHCACCFTEINKDYTGDCYVSQDKFTWLCGKCYQKLQCSNMT